MKAEEEDVQEPESGELPEAEVVEDAPPADPLEKAERERDEYMANWQRARADFQNLKRRTLEDIEAAVARERSTLLEESLTVLDYLDMALAAPCDSDEARNLQIGVQMTRDQLWAMLERQEVAPIEAEGPFDPELHQAVATVEDEGADPGSVVAVIRKGYTLAGRVLRHAHVKVAAAAGSSESDIEKEKAGTTDEEGGETR